MTVARPRQYVLALLLAIVGFNVVVSRSAISAPTSAGETSATVGSSDQSVTHPQATATRQAEQAIGRFKVPDGLKVELFAAEPLLANPVAFCFDEHGRIYVAETHRIGNGNGIEDNRGHMYWLDDDLAAKTVEDRVAYMKRRHPEKITDYTRYSEQIRLVEDTDGDGRADRANVFADGFNDIADGTGAGVLAYQGDVYYTCIPHLWKLRDNNGDGRAEQRESLHYGYGVHFAFFGHDLHGLTIGPDGRLYFSIGDRGLNVRTKEGRRLVNTDSGGVLRCELDGSNLEIFCTGLRNPQELAFDDFGNLFTCDNNSDSGDRARWNYLVEGADYGWRMYYQYLPDRGPWNREKLWHPPHEGQAAYIVPCVANITDGPSGVTYYPGTGLGDEYRGHFFVCDFRGGPTNSGVYTWSLKPKGASFELVNPRKFWTGILATDCDFGPDGGLYVSDWINGWNGTGNGRIYRAVNPAATGNPAAVEVKGLLAEGFERRPTDELVRLLAHADRRVRLEAQFVLAQRGAVEELTRVAKQAADSISQLHAIWGLGQIARRDPSAAPEIVRQIAALAGDASEHVRAQVARVLGELGTDQVEPLGSLLQNDDSRHVRHLAAIALGKQEGTSGRAAIIEAARKIEDDPVLRHSLALGLATAGGEGFGGLLESNKPESRMVALLALRRHSSPDAAKFLTDSDPRLVVEAARAIHDLPIGDGMAQLASIIDRPYPGNADDYDALYRRVLNANYRLGKPENAAALAAYAGNADAPERLRVESLEMLGQWAKPSSRDRVLGSWRPLDERDTSVAAAALRTQLAAVFGGPATVRRKAAEIASKLGVKEVVPELTRLFGDTAADASSRAAALAALSRLNGPGLDEAAKTALADQSPELRIEGRRVLAQLDPIVAVNELKQALGSGTLGEQQAAIETLALIPKPPADAVLVEWFAQMQADRFPLQLRLDLITAVRERVNRANRLLIWPEREELKRQLQAYDATAGQDPQSGFRLALAGGDADRGRSVFFEKVALSCVRCHKVGEVGGEVGPDLSKIAADKKPEYLLESIVEPSKAIAKGFETVILTLDDGRAVSGIVKQETADQVTLVTPDIKTVTIDKGEILERTAGQSAMPADLVKQMTLLELRDLVKFLSTLK
jgi:quinoprotein glucose dehydrogenase